MELLVMRKHFLKPGNDSRNMQSMDAHYSQARTSICMFMEIVRWKNSLEETIGCNNASVCHAKRHEFVFCSNSGMNIEILNPQNDYSNKKLEKINFVCTHYG
jgi:hypothetical protein